MNVKTRLQYNIHELFKLLDLKELAIKLGVGKVGTKEVNEKNIADGSILAYEASSNKMAYVIPSVGGSGDMTKAVYDINNNGIVDEAESVDWTNVQNIPDPLDANAIHDNVAGEIDALTEKTFVSGDDVFLIEDGNDALNKKKMLLIGLVPGGDGAWGVYGEKTDPFVDDDVFLIEDSETLLSTKLVDWAKIKEEMLTSVYPIGCIYTEITGTNPATTFGFGTWTAFGSGKVLVGLDSGDTDFDTVEETGGAKTKSISAHSGAAVADHAAHIHNLIISSGAVWDNDPKSKSLYAADVKGGGAPVFTGLGSQPTSNPTTTLTHSVTQPSAHSDLNVVQPYIVVHFWKRTA